MTSYHVGMLYDTSIRMRYPNNCVLFNKYKFQGYTKYALIKLPQYLHGIQQLDLSRENITQYSKICFSFQKMFISAQQSFYLKTFHSVKIND